VVDGTRQRRPISLKLTYRSSPTMMWSTTSMPSNVPAAANRWVSAMSSALGVGSPLGWTCATTSAAALARMAAFKTSRGYVAAVGLWRRRLKASGEAASRSTDAT
jgi:hypothetical protein